MRGGGGFSDSGPPPGSAGAQDPSAGGNGGAVGVSGGGAGVGGSGFSNQAPPQDTPQQDLSTGEILEMYKQQYPGQNMTNHNKAERQLYIGNIPQDIKNDELIEILNKALQQLGKDVGIFQNGNPIIGCWISSDGHYAFVDFRTQDEATQGFVLQQVQIKANYLKVGRPKNASGIIPIAS